MATRWYEFEARYQANKALNAQSATKNTEVAQRTHRIRDRMMNRASSKLPAARFNTPAVSTVESSPTTLLQTPSSSQSYTDGNFDSADESLKSTQRRAKRQLREMKEDKARRDKLIEDALSAPTLDRRVLNAKRRIAVLEGQVLALMIMLAGRSSRRRTFAEMMEEEGENNDEEGIL